MIYFIMIVLNRVFVVYEYYIRLSIGICDLWRNKPHKRKTKVVTEVAKLIVPYLSTIFTKFKLHNCYNRYNRG